MFGQVFSHFFDLGSEDERMGRLVFWLGIAVSLFCFVRLMVAKVTSSLEMSMRKC